MFDNAGSKLRVLNVMSIPRGPYMILFPNYQSPDQMPGPDGFGISV